jgi:glucose-6-phosphate 1-epimerase
MYHTNEHLRPAAPALKYSIVVGVVLASAYFLASPTAGVQELSAAMVQPATMQAQRALGVSPMQQGVVTNQGMLSASEERTGPVPKAAVPALSAAFHDVLRQNGVQGNWMLLGAVTFVASIFGYIMGRTRSAAAIPVQECQHVAVDTTSLSQSCRSTVQQNVALAATTGTKVGEGVLKVDEGGLEYAELTHPSGASAKVFTYGADVTSYVDASGTEWIAVRPDAKMDGSKPISGGLSHCFPQFGPGAIQQHGFARNVDWTVHSISESSVTYELTPSDYTRAMWDKPFKCLFTVTLKEDCLDTELVVENTGSAEAFDFQAALHSYFDISSIKNTSVGGSFSGKTFLNKMLDPPAEQVEERSEITIAEEYDRVYAGVNDPVLKDSGKGKQLKIVNSAGWKDTVLWNPYGNEGMGYDNFVCVESVAFTPVQLGAGEKWVGTMSLVPADF